MLCVLLIVAGDVEIRSAVRQALQPPFQVIVGATYDDAVSVLEWESDIQVVAADFRLDTGPSGLDVLRFAQRRAPNARRILVADESPSAVRHAVRTKVVQRYVPKPAAADALGAALRLALLGQ